ncbi:MAG TPA: SGNH/GDSL hydrolase family protein [Mycobacterium sp.]|nr:SGNH/GDSL hydrolase family protein [Mycobacterium sp.]
MDGYSRYVALGDSQTEGLWDGDDSSGLAGFADRLAARLEQHSPALLYANLAVRGHRVIDVLDSQLPQALSMKPDLITVCIGMNDVTRPGRTFDRAMADLATVYDRLADSGATVVTTTFPDLTRILPAGRLLQQRLLAVDAVIRDGARRHGFRLVDLFHAPSMCYPPTWSADRIHASARGHQLFADAAAEALELPGANHDWAAMPGTGPASPVLMRWVAQAQWTRNMFLPWAWEHARGRSACDGRAPKRPQLQPIGPACPS